MKTRPHRLSTLKVVRFGSALEGGAIGKLGQHLVRAFRRTIDRIELVERDPLPVDQIEAGLLTQVLDADVGGHILGITDADLFDSRGEDFSRFMFGGKDHRNDVAVVSTRRLRERDQALTIERLVKVSLHELGHNFGLVHHYTLATGDDGDLCPMTKGELNRYGERGYLQAVIDARGFSFCRPCTEFVRRAVMLQMA